MNSEQYVQTPAKEKTAEPLMDPRLFPKANREAKDSVFRNLFSDKKYLLMLYRTLHPEDEECTEEDLTCVTLEQILVRDIHNDLGFLARDRLLVMMEAQSTWTVNIIVRVLLYIAHTYQEYFRETSQSLFSSKPVYMPEPEMYVLYTGNRVLDKECITLADEFFGGKQIALEVRVKVLTGGEDGDILSQYVAFTRVMNEQVREHGQTMFAAEETIRICREQNILKEYLESRQKEVTDIMFTLFDQEEVLKDYIASERREAAEEMYADGIPISSIARYFKTNEETVRRWLRFVLR
ncbi:MAG: hypothetical protein LUG61_10055 [Lachnospiraceae bacterium]|nr:hypothetical protein [Lachnospiraceae bacterium]